MLSPDSSAMKNGEEEEENSKTYTPLSSTEQILLLYSLSLLTILVLVVFFSFFNLHDPNISLTHISINNSTNKTSISFCFSIVNPSTVAVLRCRKNSMVVHFFSKMLRKGALVMLPGETRVVEGAMREVLCAENVGLTHLSFFEKENPVGLVQVASWARLDARLEVFGFVSSSARAYAYCWSAFDVVNNIIGASVANSCTSY